MSQEEKNEILQDFKQELREESVLTPRHNDRLLMKFLIARQFNIVNAKKMLIDSEVWRKVKVTVA